MSGRFLKHGWHRRPVTHAAGLWALVAFAALLFIVFSVYGRRLTSIRTGLIEAKPAKTRVQSALPTVFGTVTGFDGTTLEIDSKQNYSRVLVDEVTDISRIGGKTFNPERLKAGMIVMATGHADGDSLLADTLVVLTREDLDTPNE